MKRNAIAAICSVVVAVAIVVPVALQGAPVAGTQVLGEAPVASATATAPDASAAGAAGAATAGFDSDDETGDFAGDGDGAAGDGDGTTDGATYGATDDEAATSTWSAGDPDDDIPTYEQDAILVNVRDGATAADLNAQLAGLDYIATKRVDDDDIASGYVKLALVGGTDVKDAEARIVDDAAGVVADSQPNYLYRLLDDIPAAAAEPASAATSGLIASIIAQATAIDDPLASKQWALDAVNAYDAWDIARGDGSAPKGASAAARPVVAVIDNGFLVSHEDLESNIVATYNALNPRAAVSPYYGYSQNYHGTHVCGIIAATANNGTGVAGVSYNAGLLPIQAFEPVEGKHVLTASTLTIANAYNYIIGKANDYKRGYSNGYNIKVVNMSLGSTYGSMDDADEEDTALIDAVEKAYDAGILTVCSAGNDAGTMKGAYLNFPSDWVDCALGVIASEKSGERASYSNYNTDGQITKDITAPGSSIRSTLSASTRSYGDSSGTSMAAPCVAGIAALVYSVNSEFSAADVSNIICATAKDLGEEGWDNEYGFGLVDAGAAVAYAKQVTDGTDGNPSPEIKVKTIVSSATATMELSQPKFTYDGAAKTPGVTVKVGDTTLVQGVDYTLVYSDNTDVGTARVEAVAKGDYIGAVSGEFTIEHAPIASVALSSKRFTYSGSAKTPAVTVRGAKNGMANQVLVQGVDYTLAYSNNVNAGTATATVVGKGSYSDSKSEAFTIAPAPLESLTLSATSFKYSGGVKTPGVTVKGVKGGKAGQVLTQGSDYSLALPSKRKAVGTYSVVVTGVGNYTGSMSASFKIIPAGTALGKLTAVSKGFTARWSKRTAQTSGYQLQYGLKSSFKSAKTVTVKSVKTVSKRVTKLKAKRKYYVRVRTYKTVGGKTYYSAWSGKKAVTTKR